MTSQTLAAFAASVHLAMIASACAAGILLARRVRVAWWIGAATMLLLVRSVTTTTAHAWSTPSAPDSFPVIDAALASVSLAGLAWAAIRARAARSGTPVPATVLAATPDGDVRPEAHADAA